ncbi:MAG: hypothetical protein CVU59_10015 [Deltaproteobacteria bacterium HGW-Deltaproteobacteria-17]|nr:MAG: hypothetical protein CVU59_10015 [Deltaproteobacteria bacterium HGW-Deltaproteobacteria-17]
MYLSAFTHREKLFDIAKRWLEDKLEPDDAWLITEIFTYEGFVTTPMVRQFLTNFMRELHDKEITTRSVTMKHQVKEAVTRSIPSIGERMEFLIRMYHSRPEEYFPRAPINGIMFFAGQPDPKLVAMLRIKRARRVAEKVSRRMADMILTHIRNKAETLAKERAERLGIPLEMLLTPPEQMVSEFEAAERQLAEQVMSGRIPFNKEDLEVPDVIGIKIIGDELLHQRAVTLLQSHPDVHVVELETHQGDYNAINVQFDLRLPEPGVIIDSVSSNIVVPFPATRGISPEELQEGFAAYVESGERTVRVELILTTYEELVESEIGRSIHEMRTLKQRSQREYTGRIAKNAEFIVEYMLSVAFSPQIAVNFIPIKLNGHYLPETVSYAIRKLYGIEESAIFTNLSL